MARAESGVFGNALDGGMEFLLGSCNILWCFCYMDCVYALREIY